MLGALQAQGIAIVEKCFGVGGGVFLERLATGDGVADDFVVHVRNVHHMVEVVAIGFQALAEHVYKGEGTEITDVREIVYSWTASVHTDGVVACGRKLFELLGQRIVETQRHSL